MDKRAGATEAHGYLPNRAPLRTQRLQLGGVDRHGFAAYAEAFRAAVSNASFDPLTDEITLELGEAGHHVEHEPSSRGGEIEAITQTNEGDAEGFKFAQG